MSFGLGISRYLPSSCVSALDFRADQALRGVLLHAGVGYGQLLQLLFYARMGLGRPTMVSALFAPLRTHRACACVLVRADISQVDSSDVGA